MEEELRLRWGADLGRSRAATEAVEELLARYREPHRRYHGLAHILRVLRTLDELVVGGDGNVSGGDAVGGDGNVSGGDTVGGDANVSAGDAVGGAVADPAAVRLAAWYHDAVYDPRAPEGANEAASAELAARVLPTLRQSDERVSAVVRLVEVTAAHHPAAAAADEAALCDADLAILAADPAAYSAYVNGIRAEYGHLSDDEWRRGRASVLRSLLDRPVLFHTPAMAGRDRAARANMTAELADLAT